MTKTFPAPANFNGLLYQSQDFIRTLNIFFHIIWAPNYWFSTKILILKHIFYFVKIVKVGPLTNIFATPAYFNRPLYQSQDFIRTLNIFSSYLSYLLLIQQKSFNFKHIFYFLKIVKGDPWQKFFATPANFNRPLYQSQNFIRTLNIFSYYLSYLLLIQHKNVNFKDIFYFQKSVKGGPLTKTFQLLQTLTGHCTKVGTSFEF